MFDNYMLNEAVQLLYFILCIIGVVGVAGIMVFTMYGIEEGFKNTAKKVLKSFGCSNGGVRF